MKPLLFLSAVILVCCACASARADIVILEDCRKLEGETKREGENLIVSGPFGKLKIPRKYVWKIIEQETPWAKFERCFKDIATDNAKGYLELGKWAKTAGLRAEANRAFEAAMAADPENAEARALLNFEKINGVWLRGEELLIAKGWKKHEGYWYEPEEYEKMSRTTPEEAKLIVDEIVNLVCSKKEQEQVEGLRKIKDLGPNRSRRFFLKGVKDGKHPAMRLASVKALRDYGLQKEIVNALLLSTLADNNREVRTAALESLRHLEVPNMSMTYNRALYSEIKDVHERSLDAIDYFRFQESVPHLLRFVEVHEVYTGGPNGQYFENTQVESYIADYEGLIATQAAILDPVIKQLRTGTILHVQVRVVEIIRNILGVDLGDDPSAYRKYMRSYIL